MTQLTIANKIDLKPFEMLKMAHTDNFREMYQGQFTPEPDKGGMYRMSEAEHWMLQAYAIQHMDQEQDEFEIELVYPDRIPAKYAMTGLRVPPPERGLDSYLVWGIFQGKSEVGTITTLLGFWDERMRIKWMWHDDESDRFDPADVLSDGGEKWIHVYEYKDSCGDIDTERSTRTTYNDAGGKHLDQRQQQITANTSPHVSPFESYSICNRTRWREQVEHRMNAPMYPHGSRNIQTRDNYATARHFSTREKLDRAHADEMMGPAKSDNLTR